MQTTEIKELVEKSIVVSEDDARRVQPLCKLIKAAAVKVNKTVDRQSTSKHHTSAA